MVKKRPPATLLIAFIVVCVLAIIALKTVFPRDVAAAKGRNENEGYTNVTVSETRLYSGKNRKVFVFSETSDNGEAVSGRLCFDLIRFFSPIEEGGGR